jgi:hypothetical protein
MRRTCQVFAIMFLALLVFAYLWPVVMNWLGQPPFAGVRSDSRPQAAQAGPKKAAD